MNVDAFTSDLLWSDPITGAGTANQAAHSSELGTLAAVSKQWVITAKDWGGTRGRQMVDGVT